MLTEEVVIFSIQIGLGNCKRNAYRVSVILYVYFKTFFRSTLMVQIVENMVQVMKGGAQPAVNNPNVNK